jgi:hypothetical protein
MAGPVVVKILEHLEELTADDLNTIFQAMANRFGQVEGTDLQYPFIAGGDFDLGGNKMVGAREIFEVINLEEFGSDDSAFGLALSELSSGGMILLPSNSTITMSRGLKVRENRNRLWIMGQGHSSKIQMASNSDDHALSFDGCFRFRVSNLQIDGNADNNVTGHGIWVNESQDFEINNVWIGSGSASGVAGSGIVLDRCSDFSVKRSWIRNPRRHGILVEDECEGFNITQVFITHLNNPNDAAGNPAGGDGILLRDQCIDGLVDSCTIRDINLRGIAVRDCTNIRLAYNTVRRNSIYTVTGKEAGIQVGGTSEDIKCEGATVFGNTSTENVIGIEVGSYVTGQIMCNYCRGNSGSNIVSDSDSARVTLRDNKCLDVAHHGKVQFPAGVTFVDLDVGVASLPIQAIVATWNYTGDLVDLTDAVLGTRYTGQTITFYTASTLAIATDCYYSVEV